MEISYSFKETCPHCSQDSEVPTNSVRVNVPNASARELGMKANYLAQCSHCSTYFRGDVTEGDVTKLANNWASINMFGIPSSPDIEPNYQPPVSRSDVRQFARRLRTSSPTVILASLLDPRDFE